MQTVFIVNFVGQASPATIKELAAVTHENGGKWLISKVNFIEDQVAGVIKIELPTAAAEIVKHAFFSNPDLLVQFVESSKALNNHDMIYQLRLDANDRAGIVNDITHVLDGRGISILDMDCHRVFIAGGSGISSSLFTANMAIRLPEKTRIEDVTDELESLTEDTRVTVEA